VSHPDVTTPIDPEHDIWALSNPFSDPQIEYGVYFERREFIADYISDIVTNSRSIG